MSIEKTKPKPHFILTGGKRPEWLAPGVLFKALHRNKAAMPYGGPEAVIWWAPCTEKPTRHPFDIIAVMVGTKPGENPGDREP